MNIHFIQHEIFEAPGAYLEWARERGHSVRFSKVFGNEPLPATLDGIDLLIVMGGPQSPDTSRDECPYFDSEAEITFIQKAINEGKAIIGVCLGAQLIGEAYGAKYEHSPEKEIGVWAIELTEDGLSDEKISHLGKSLFVGHWHSDMPGLTSQSQILASSIGCPRQIIAYSHLVYGFQCHMEFTPGVIELLIAEEVEFLTNSTKYKYVQKPHEMRKFDYSEMNNKLFQFLDKFTISIKKKL